MIKGQQNRNFLEANVKFCWVVALQCEARPLIKMFNMKSLSNRLLFSIYVNYNNGHVLVVSGMGMVKAAAASMFLKEKLLIGGFAAWINIGVAGYFKGKRGALYQALKVTNRDNNKSYFPGLHFSKIVPGTSLYTVSTPEKKYSEPVLYDMEAAGFCELVPLFSCNELTYVFKIVSDTPHKPLSILTKKIISELININGETIFKLVEAIEKLVKEETSRLKVSDEVQEMLGSLHFTETNRFRFEKTYKRWRSAFPERALIDQKQPPSSAKDLIHKLENELLIKAENWRLK